MNFPKRLFLFIIINIGLTFLTIICIKTINMSGVSPLIYGLIATTFITTIFAIYFYRKGDMQIWYIPLSQIIFCSGICLFLYIQDALGNRHSSGWIDFGVGFDIVVIMILGGVWILPSIIIAIIYKIIIKNKIKNQQK